jgi:hypothetical protein
MDSRRTPPGAWVNRKKGTRSVTETVEVMRAALVEARAVILTVISNAMILESDYDPNQHPVIKQIDAALAKAKVPATLP